MTALNFPASPNNGDTFVNGDVTYTWDGVKWTAKGADPGHVLRAGDTMTGHLSSTERTITAGAFDLATGNFWTCGAIAIPNPANAKVAMSGLIRLTAAPTGWGGNFKHAGGSATAPTAFPAIVPFYVQAADTILVGKPVEGMA